MTRADYHRRYNRLKLAGDYRNAERLRRWFFKRYPVAHVAAQGALSQRDSRRGFFS